LNRYDRVLVPSRFNAAVFKSSGVTAPLFVVPHIARPAQPPAVPARPGSDGRFVFYLIATWTSRKAILDAVSAYLTAFTADDAVALLIHTTAEDHVASARLARHGQPMTGRDASTWFTLANALAGRRRAPDITLSTSRLTRAEVDALHAQGDCFVCLSRGEGWGLGAFDAAAVGNPVIVTGWGGTVDFLPAGYPYCVDYDLVPTITDEPDLWWEPRPGEHWAKASIAHAATLLRRVFDHRDEAFAWGNVLRSNIYANFASAPVTHRLIDALGRRSDLVPAGNGHPESGKSRQFVPPEN
jgi:glycosyltransferase involved in cell wall biosynthesis